MPVDIGKCGQCLLVILYSDDVMDKVGLSTFWNLRSMYHISHVDMWPNWKKIRTINVFVKLEDCSWTVRCTAGTDKQCNKRNWTTRQQQKSTCQQTASSQRQNTPATKQHLSADSQQSTTEHASDKTAPVGRQPAVNDSLLARVDDNEWQV